MATATHDAVGWTAGELTVGEFSYRFWEAGGGPPLVVFHGGGGVDLAPAFLTLSRANRVICFELPGFGESPPNPSAGTYAELAAVMAEAIEQLRLASFSLLGVSFGGAVAAWLAAQRPDLIDRLVLVAPASLRVGTRLPQLEQAELRAALRAHPDDDGRPALAPEVADRQRRVVERIWGLSSDDDLRRALDGLDLPTLVVFGTRDRLIPPESGREYKRLIPRSTLALVYDAAHEVSRDRPEAFAALVGDFLERADAHVVARASRLINP
jgi:pimeloyl-ACP methyl ester carboxylesterase